jgi:trimethylamine:corrinoid methyltransferase-like protein
MAHTYGAGSDTPDVDSQSLAERSLICQTVALAGADILGGVGQLECATVFSPVQAVLDNELGAMLRRFIRVNDIDDEELNWAEASQIRTGGHFLDSAHTLNRCRQQHSPDVFMREDRDNYEKINRRTAIDQARDKCMELIKAPDPNGLPSNDALAEIAKVVADADRLILEAAAANKGPRDEI